MTYHAAAAPLPGQGKRKGGAITFWIGLVILVASLALAVVTGLMSYNAIREAVDEAEGFSGDTAITLQAGDERTIYQVEEGNQQAECVVTGPDGQELTLTRGAALSASSNGTSYVDVGSFTAEVDGEHQIACEGPRTLVGPALDVRGAIGGFFGVFAGIGGAFLGGILALVGAIIWFVGRSESKRALRSGPGGGYGYGSGGYQQGGYRAPQGPPPPPPPPSNR